MSSDRFIKKWKQIFFLNRFALRAFDDDARLNLTLGFLFLYEKNKFTPPQVPASGFIKLIEFYIVTVRFLHIRLITPTDTSTASQLELLYYEQKLTLAKTAMGEFEGSEQVELNFYDLISGPVRKPVIFKAKMEIPNTVKSQLKEFITKLLTDRINAISAALLVNVEEPLAPVLADHNTFFSLLLDRPVMSTTGPSTGTDMGSFLFSIYTEFKEPRFEGIRGTAKLRAELASARADARAAQAAWAAADGEDKAGPAATRLLASLAFYESFLSSAKMVLNNSDEMWNDYITVIYEAFHEPVVSAAVEGARLRAGKKTSIVNPDLLKTLNEKRNALHEDLVQAQQQLAARERAQQQLATRESNELERERQEFLINESWSEGDVVQQDMYKEAIRWWKDFKKQSLKPSDVYNIYVREMGNIEIPTKEDIPAQATSDAATALVHPNNVPFDNKFVHVPFDNEFAHVPQVLNRVKLFKKIGRNWREAVGKQTKRGGIYQRYLDSKIKQTNDITEWFVKNILNEPHKSVKGRERHREIMTGVYEAFHKRWLVYALNQTKLIINIDLAAINAINRLIDNDERSDEAEHTFLEADPSFLEGYYGIPKPVTLHFTEAATREKFRVNLRE